MYWYNKGFYETKIAENAIELSQQEYNNIMEKIGNGGILSENEFHFPIVEECNEYYINIFENELNELLKWFDLDYARKEQKFRRLRTLNLLCDDGVEPYDALIKLYNDAEIKRKRIQELEILIAEAKELKKQNQIKGEMIDA